MTTIILETERLMLRPVAVTDAEAFMAYAQHPDYRFHLRQPACTLDEMKTGIEKEVAENARQPAMCWHFSLLLREDAQLFGNIKLWRDESVSASGLGKIGYGSDPAFWNRGLMTEAVKAVTQFGHDRIKLHRIQARCNNGNIGSWRVLEKAGYEREGVIRYGLYNAGDQSWEPEGYVYASVKPDLLP